MEGLVYYIFIQSNFIQKKTKQVHKNPGHKSKPNSGRVKDIQKANKEKKSDIKQNTKRMKNQSTRQSGGIAGVGHHRGRKQNRQRVRNEPNYHLNFDVEAFNPKGLVSAIPQSVATQENSFGHVPEK